MKLFSSSTSPFVRKVRIAAIEMGLMDQIEEVMIKTNAIKSDPAIAAANPLAKIPALETPDGMVIFDSRVICHYLEAHSRGVILHPAGDYKHETLIALADGVLDAAVLMAYEHMLRPETMVFEPWVEGQWRKIEAALAVFEGDYEDYRRQLNMGMISMMVALEYLDLRHDARNWRGKFPALADWHEANKDRESYATTRPIV